MSPGPIIVLRARPSDFPTLASIAMAAMSVDLIHMVAFPSANALDVSPQEKKLLSELHQWHDAGNPIWKAILAGDGDKVSKECEEGGEEILGFTSMRIVDEVGAERPLERGFMPENTNLEFVRRMRGGLEDVYSRCMAGRRHILLKLLMVRPDMQRQGIASALMKHGFEHLDAQELPVWVTTQERAYDVYLKAGFRGAGLVDIDMAEFMGENRGFGVHRSWALVKDPSEEVNG